jgi:hypothetical protein
MTLLFNLSLKDVSSWGMSWKKKIQEIMGNGRSEAKYMAL